MHSSISWCHLQVTVRTFEWFEEQSCLAATRTIETFRQWALLLKDAWMPLGNLKRKITVNILYHSWQKCSKFGCLLGANNILKGEWPTWKLFTAEVQWQKITLWSLTRFCCSTEKTNEVFFSPASSPFVNARLTHKKSMSTITQHTATKINSKHTWLWTRERTHSNQHLSGTDRPLKQWHRWLEAPNRTPSQTLGCSAGWSSPSVMSVLPRP